jgi:hypothetical protein
MALSFVKYTGDGTTKNYPVTFQYIAQTDVTVSVDGVSVPFTWLSESLIQITSAPASGTAVDIRRTTKRDNALVDFQDASTLTEPDLDTMTDQLLFIAQEAYDLSQDSLRIPIGKTAFDAITKRIINLADPVNPQDATTKQWVASTYAAALNTAAASAAAALSSSANAAVSATNSAFSAAAAAADAATIAGVAATALQYPSRAAAAAATISGGALYINVQGYAAAGDGGAALYVRSAGAPSNNIKFQSADGAWWKLVTDAGYVSARVAGAKFDHSTDDTLLIQKVLDDCNNVTFPPLSANISDKLNLRSGHSLIFPRGCIIKQTTASKPILSGVDLDGVNLHFFGGILIGEGTFGGNPGGPWTGTGSSQDRGIYLRRCNNVMITYPHIKNCGQAGVYISGGNGITVVSPRVEGTHNYSTPIVTQANFQCGVMIEDLSGTNEVVNNCLITGHYISEVCQGILIETNLGSNLNGRHIVLADGRIENTFQHAHYIDSGGVSLTGCAIRNTQNAAVKFQVGDYNNDTGTFMATGIIGQSIGTNLFEISVPDLVSYPNAKAGNIEVEGVGKGVKTGIAIKGPVRNLYANVIVEDCSSNGLDVSNDGATNCEVHLTARNISGNGVDINASNVSRFKVYPTIINPNTAASNVNGFGIIVQGANSVVDIYDPVIIDGATNMLYGIYNSVASAIVRVHGSAEIANPKNNHVRAIGKITEWPTEVRFIGSVVPFLGQNLVSSSQPMKMTLTTTSATNAPIWSRTLDPASSYLIDACIVAKLASGAERKVWHQTLCAYRAAGGSVLQGAVADLFAPIASASFTGAISWIFDTNEVYLMVNSGGGNTYNWTARITVTPV